MSRLAFIFLFLTSVLFGQFRYIVSDGVSMNPALKKGDLLLVYPFKYEALKPGMIVTFKPKWSENQVTHRLVRYVPKRGWITKGDNNKRADPGYMTKENFVGWTIKIEK
jgi:signal peptidase I